MDKGSTIKDNDAGDSVMLDDGMVAPGISFDLSGVEYTIDSFEYLRRPPGNLETRG